MVAKEIDGKDVAGAPSRLIFFFSAIRERGATTYEANITFQPQKNDYSVDMVEKFLTEEIKGTDSLKEHVAMKVSRILVIFCLFFSSGCRAASFDCNYVKGGSKRSFAGIKNFQS